MGWTCLRRDKGQTTAAFLAAELLGEGQTFVAHGSHDGVFYAAVRESATDQVWAAVVLTKWYSGEWNYGYKPQSEEMGPHDSRAPARVLDALTRTTSKEANEWRQRCRANLAAAASRPRVRPGDVVRFAHPLAFTNGDTADTFTYRGGSRFAASGLLYTITKWRQRAYSVVSGSGVSA